MSKKVVLGEEEYLRVLEGILRRDYYPELPPLLTEEENDYTLEAFQAQYTSEDDASFSTLLAKANDERARLYKSRYTTSLDYSSSPHPLLLSANNNNKTDSLIIKPENTRYTTMTNNNNNNNRSVVGKRLYNFVPMTPKSISTPSTTSTSTTLSPAAKNLLRSVRKRQQPFGGATPSKNNNKNDFL